jgi:glucose/arabinose dehydrogenase
VNPRARGRKRKNGSPPLKVPAGFKATLFACNPLIEYPSVISAGPRPGAIFVAVDYLTGLGTEIIRHDEIRLIEDTDGDGYADKATVFAKGFNSIQGLAYHGGTLYVMSALGGSEKWNHGSALGGSDQVSIRRVSSGTTPADVVVHKGGAEADY